MAVSRRWVIFDADNTLWAVEPLYDHARALMCQFLASRGVDPARAEEYQRARDKQLYVTYGYSACRFPRSFEDTILRFVPDADPLDVIHVRRLASEVFEQQPMPNDGLEELVALLNNDYHLGIITAGERWVQERRLQQFNLRERFDAVEIVEHKNALVYTAFCAKYAVDKLDSFVVGDSLRSDVLPAIEAGLHPILFQASNWAVVESDTQAPAVAIPIVHRLIEVAEIVGTRQSKQLE